jgi:hypothetical protein
MEKSKKFNPNLHPLHFMKFLPSVDFLLRKNNISLELVASIPTSGPKGSLLKGDLLNFLTTLSTTNQASLRIYSTTIISNHLSTHSSSFLISRACVHGN